MLHFLITFILFICLFASVLLVYYEKDKEEHKFTNKLMHQEEITEFKVKRWIFTASSVVFGILMLISILVYVFE